MIVISLAITIDYNGKIIESVIISIADGWLKTAGVLAFFRFYIHAMINKKSQYFYTEISGKRLELAKPWLTN